MTDLQHISHWVFDLDNTLYHPSGRLFDQIERRMVAYVMKTLGLDEAGADHLRADYWRRYGTTLSGLMAEHDLDPLPFLRDVHDIDMTHLPKDPTLRDIIQALPGRRIVYTNGDADYAARVCEARGLGGVFDAIYGIEHAGFVPKPQASAYQTVFAQADVVPAQAIMFEDDLRNLEVPHALGMATVLVHGAADGAAHVDHETQDLTGFLSRLVW